MLPSPVGSRRPFSTCQLFQPFSLMLSRLFIVTPLPSRPTALLEKYACASASFSSVSASARFVSSTPEVSSADVRPAHSSWSLTE